MDFSAFSTPGRYRVLVEGIGTSYPFPIAREVWGDAFKVSMAGLLHHRSGIELGPPFTEYKRPRTMHPADGFKVFQLNITRLDGEADKVNADLQKGTEGRKLEPDAWGGYMDAGDWDRRSQHLSVTYDLLELFELFPAHFKNVKLALPPSEARNTLPDILDEARWNLDFYKRLQLPDGGVRGGVEQTAHPSPRRGKLAGVAGRGRLRSRRGHQRRLRRECREDGALAGAAGCQALSGISRLGSQSVGVGREERP
jgi:endoglucanase